MTRVLVCGGREFNDPTFIWRNLTSLHARRNFTVVIQGGAKGVDTFARIWAEQKTLPCEEYAADWANKGKAAGPIRNRRMLEEGKPDLVIAFPGGRGTANMVEQARAAGIEVIEVKP